MRIFAAFRCATHVSLFFAAASAAALFAGSEALPFVILAALLLLALIAVHLEKAALRLAVMLPAALLLLFARGPAQLIAAAVPIAYAVLTAALGRFDMERWKFINEVKLCALFAAASAAAALLTGYVVNNESRIPIACARSAWAFLFLAFVLCVTALRAIRTGYVKSRAWQAGNIAFFLLPILAACAFGFVLMYVVWPVVKYAFFGVSSGFILALSGLYNAIAAFYAFGKDLGSQNAVPTMPPSIDVEPGPDLPVLDLPDPTHVPRPFPKPEIDLLPILIVLLIAAVIAAAVLLIRRGRAGKREYADDGLKRFVLGANESLRSGRRRRKRDKSLENADRVRSVYRQYLAFLHMHGVVPEKSETSAEISRDASGLIVEGDGRLRSLYRRARYSGGDMTEEDVRTAEAEFDRISADGNLRSQRGSGLK